MEFLNVYCETSPQLLHITTVEKLREYLSRHPDIDIQKTLLSLASPVLREIAIIIVNYCAAPFSIPPNFFDRRTDLCHFVITTLFQEINNHEILDAIFTNPQETFRKLYDFLTQRPMGPKNTNYSREEYNAILQTIMKEAPASVMYSIFCSKKETREMSRTDLIQYMKKLSFDTLLHRCAEYVYEKIDMKKKGEFTRQVTSTNWSLRPLFELLE